MPGPYTASNDKDHPFSRAESFFVKVREWRARDALEITHHDLEEQLSVDGQELMRLLYQGHLDLRATKEERLSSVTGPDGRARTHARHDAERPLMTVFGPVRVRRIRYSGRYLSRTEWTSPALGGASRVLRPSSVYAPYGAAETSTFTGLSIWSASVRGITLRRYRAQPKRPRERRSMRAAPIVDITGVKIYGQGEWDAAKHRQTKRRRGRNLHLIIHDTSLEILGHALTTDEVGDVTEAPGLLTQVGEDVQEFMGDGAYDSQQVYDATNASSCSGTARVVVPPRKNAVLSRTASEKQTQRDRHLLVIAALGRRGWEEHVGIERRRLVENAMFRFKTVIGRRLRARDLSAERTEAALGCKVLNRMTRLGLPRTRSVV